MTRDDLWLALDNPNVGAFLRAIRLGEGTSDPDGYRRIVGGELVDDLSRHPFDGTGRAPVFIPRYQVYSTASGAYQIILRTWKEMERQYDLPDFEPDSQDLAAVGLIVRRGALERVAMGYIEEAIRLCAKEWASLPGAGYGQREESLERVLAEYVEQGGKLA